MQPPYIERLVKEAADFGGGKIHIIVNNVLHEFFLPRGLGGIS